MDFVLAAVWIALNAWIGEHGVLLGAALLSVAGPGARAVRR